MDYFVFEAAYNIDGMKKKNLENRVDKVMDIDGEVVDTVEKEYHYIMRNFDYHYLNYL